MLNGAICVLEKRVLINYTNYPPVRSPGTRNGACHVDSIPDVRLGGYLSVLEADLDNSRARINPRTTPRGKHICELTHVRTTNSRLRRTANMPPKKHKHKPYFRAGIFTKLHDSKEAGVYEQNMHSDAVSCRL